MLAALAAGGYYIYTKMQASSATTPAAGTGDGSSADDGSGDGSTVSGYLGRPRRRRIMRQGGGGAAPSSSAPSGAASQGGWGDTQDASQYDPLGVEFENEAGYS